MDNKDTVGRLRRAGASFCLPVIRNSFLATRKLKLYRVMNFCGWFPRRSVVMIFFLAKWAKHRLLSLFTILPLRSPHGLRQLKPYWSFRLKCQNNANLIMLIRWKEFCLSSGCLRAVALLAVVGNNLSIYFPLKFGKDTKSEKKTALIRLLTTQVIFPKENKPSNLLNARQPASRI